MLKRFQIWSVGAPLSCPLVFLTCPYQYMSTLLLSGTIRCVMVTSYFPCPIPEITCFSKEPYFYWGSVIRYQNPDN